jgi:hypothetical protein
MLQNWTEMLDAGILMLVTLVTIPMPGYDVYVYVHLYDQISAFVFIIFNYHVLERSIAYRCSLVIWRCEVESTCAH